MASENKKVLVKFNEAATDDVAKGNLVKRGLGITTESRGFYVRTESDEFLFIPSEENLLDDGAARIGISSPTLSGTVKGVLISHQAVIQSLGGLATKTVILNADVSSEAGIAWSKISKLGAVASDVGAAPVVDGKIPSQYIPAVALTDIFEVASEAAMLALNAQLGDYAIRTDSNQKYMLKAEPATVLANWLLINDGGAVLSVDGRTGVVTLDDLYKDIAWTPNWADINDKPLTFTPSSHTHVWADITDKPLTFTPSAHSHLISDVTNLQGALDGKQPLNDFLTSLSGFSAASNGFIRVMNGNLNVDQSTYSLSSHSHNTLGAVTFTDAISGTSATFSGDASAGSFTEGGVPLASKYSLDGHTHPFLGGVTFSGEIRFDADNSYNIGQPLVRPMNIYSMAVTVTNTVSAGTVSAGGGVFNTVTPSGAAKQIGGPGGRWTNGYFVDLDASGVINAVTLRQDNVDISTLFATSGHNHNGVYAPLASPTFTGTVTIEDGSIRNTIAGVVRFGNKNRAETEGFTHSSNGLVFLEAGNSINLNAVGFINLATANSETTGLRFASDKVLYGISGGLRTNGTLKVDSTLSLPNATTSATPLEIGTAKVWYENGALKADKNFSLYRGVSPTNQKYWEFGMTDGALLIQAVNDAYNAGSSFIRFNRSGQTAVNIQADVPMTGTKHTTSIGFGSSSIHAIPMTANAGTWDLSQGFTAYPNATLSGDATIALSNCQVADCRLLVSQDSTPRSVTLSCTGVSFALYGTTVLGTNSITIPASEFPVASGRYWIDLMFFTPTNCSVSVRK